MWLTALWVVPLIGSAAAALAPVGRAAAARWIGLAFSLATLAIAIGLAVGFSTGEARPYRYDVNASWIPAFGAGYRLGLDGVGLVLVLLTAALVPVLLIAGWRDAGEEDRRTQTYVGLFLAVESMVLVSFVATDLLLFYLVFEAMLIPMYFLIGGYGGSERSRAAVKFLLYNLVGGLVMLAALVWLWAQIRGENAFDLNTVSSFVDRGRLSETTQNVVFLGFLFAFAVKAPLWPLHTWLPGAAVQSTPPTAVLMMAIVDKVGTFGMLRFCVQLFPDAADRFAPWVIALAVVGIVYGAVLAIGQTDMMALIAYTSISHFGFIILGIFAATTTSQSGATLYMVNHGVATAALFLAAGFLVTRGGSREIADYGGARAKAPVLMGLFLIGGLATLSLPGLGPFVSELMVFVGSFEEYRAAAIVATIALVLSALYVLWLYQRVATGPTVERLKDVRDVTGRELTVLVPLIVALLVLGLFPQPALDAINSAVSMSTYNGSYAPLNGVRMVAPEGLR